MAILNRKRTAWEVSASLAFALLLAATVIFAAGYYEGPDMLFGQVVAIAGPTAVPLLIAPKHGRMAVMCWLAIAALVVAGWSYVVYIDTRPYQGGGASFAVLIGWFTCLAACPFAVLARALLPQPGKSN